jgi:hypothetical protein
LFLVAAVFTFTVLAKAQDSKDPAVSFTLVPHSAEGGPGQTEAIAGEAKGVNFANYKIVVYARGGNGVWYVQPTVADPITDIGTDGKWATDTHLGRSYAALLVKSGFKPSATLDSLPVVGSDVVAVARVAGEQ